MDKERFTSEIKASNDPDKPPVITQTIQANTSLTFPTVVRGQVIGGGTSRDAFRRARRRLGRTGPSSIIDYKL